MKNRLGPFAFIDAVFAGCDRFYDREGAGISEDAWPDIPVPEDVTRSDVPPAPRAADATPPPATPPASATPPATPPATPAAGAPATPAPAGAPAAGTPEPATAEQGLEELRRSVSEIATFNRQLLEQNTVLVQQNRDLHARLNQPPPAPPAPAAEPPDPQTLAIRDRMMQVFPWFKDLEELVGKKAALLGAAEAVPQVMSDRQAAQQAQDHYWDSYRDSQFQAAQDAVAKEVLGDGKAGKDLDPIVRSMVETAYRTWVTADPARAARYERQDQQLLGEFVSHYKALMIAPVRRTENVAALDAAAAAPPIPRGGPSAAPAPPAPTPPTPPKDEDALFSDSWRQFQDRRAS